MTEHTRKPNILFIMADQLMPFLTGAYGHTVVRTPNLDRLVREGVRFDNAYTPYPLCGPTRAAIATGKYASELGIVDNACIFPSDHLTYSHYLTLAGYDCVASGKLHYVGADQLHGFSRRLTTDIYPEDLRWLQNRDPDLAAQEQHKGKHAAQYIAAAIRVEQGWYPNLSYDEEVVFRSMEFLRAQGLEKRRAIAAGTDHERPPFLLFSSFHHPHDPFIPPLEYWNLYEDVEIDLPDLPDNLHETYSVLDRWLNQWHAVDQYPVTDPDSLRVVRRAYYALVTYIDDKVGQLLHELERNNLLDETVIVFTGDHGDMLGEKGMVQKRNFYEWSLRVPLIFRFPHGEYAGTTLQQPVSLLDLLPTFLDLGGVPEHLPVRGHNLMPLIRGERTQSWDVFAESHAEGVYGTCFMLRTERYKYIYIAHRDGVDVQLFDMQNDPQEWHNLAGKPQYAAEETALRARLLAEFDPAAIESAIQQSIPVRRMLKAWMERVDVTWVYTPHFDADKRVLDQYLR